MPQEIQQAEAELFDKHVSQSLKQELESAVAGDEGLFSEAQLFTVVGKDAGDPGIEFEKDLWDSFEEKISEVIVVAEKIADSLQNQGFDQTTIVSVLSVLKKTFINSLEPIQDNLVTIQTKDKNNLQKDEKIKIESLNLAHYFELRLKIFLEEKKQEKTGVDYADNNELKKYYFALKHSPAVKKSGVFKKDLDDRTSKYSGIEQKTAGKAEIILTTDEVRDIKLIAETYGDEYGADSNIKWLTATFFRNATRKQSVEDRETFHPVITTRLENLQTLLQSLIDVGDVETLQDQKISITESRIIEVLEYTSQLLETHKQIELNDVSQMEEFTSWRDTVLSLIKVDDSNSVESLLSKAAQLLEDGTLVQHKDAILPQLSAAMSEVLSQRRIVLDGRALYATNSSAVLAASLSKEKQSFLNETVDKLKRIIETFDPAEINLYKGTITTVGEFSPPPQKTESAYLGEYKRILENRTEDAIIKFLDGEMYELEEIEHGYSERERFKHSEEGIRFLGLKKWIEYAIKEIPSLHKYHAYFENRIAFAEMMGPYAASNKITADFRKSVEENYPEYAVWNHQYFFGTKEGGEKYEHAQAVRFAERQIEAYMHEQYDFINNPSKDGVTYKQGNDFVEGFWSLGRGQWMSGEGNFNGKLIERLIAETHQKYPDLSEEKLKIITRVAFSAFALTGGKGDGFVSFYSIGMSPPQVAEIGFMIECYPEAKEFNLACKKVTEIAPVVHGMRVSRRWLLKMATKNGLYAYFEENGEYQNDDYEAGKLWGIPGAPDVEEYREFNDYINGLEEDECEKVLDLIKSGKRSNSNSYTRFRNLLRSIELSEAKSKLLNMYDKDRKMQLLDRDGTPNEKGDLIAPLVMTPRMMMFGATEFITEESDVAGYYADLETNFHDVHLSAHDALVKFRSKIYSSPPDIKSGIDHQHDAIHALAQDFFECLALTSAMKAQISMVNWPKVQQMFDFRLHVIFATYKAAGFNALDKPARPIGEVTSEFFGLSISVENESLVQALQHILETSGQTMGGKGETTWMNVAHERNGYGSISKKYEVMGKELAFKEALLQPLVSKGDVSRGSRTMSEMKKVSGGMYRGGSAEKGRLKFFNESWNTYKNLRNKYKVSEADTLSDTLLPRDSAEKKSQESDLSDAESKGKGK
jgi:hypothetical protein